MEYEDYRVIVDTPSKLAGLGFVKFARALSQTIEASRPQFAIGIFGPWGSGKTTLMQNVQTLLNPERTVCVEFSAWRYEREEHLLVPLLDTIRVALVNWANEQAKQAGAASQAAQAINDAAINTAKTIGKVITSIIAGVSLKVGIPNALEFSFKANEALSKAKEVAEANDLSEQVKRRGTANFPQSIYHICFLQLKEAFGELRKVVKDNDSGTELRFVVFVDDLDRCLPQGALEVLEAIKLFFEMEGFIFVVGLDRSIVERFIEQRYVTAQNWTTTKPTPNGPVTAIPEKASPLVTGSDYIKKIFQVPFTLAPVQLSQLQELIDAMATEAELPPLQAADLRGRVLRHLQVALSDLAINPREVKRYINSYVMQMKITPLLNPDVVLAIQTIRARLDWKAIDDALAVYRDEFLTHLQSDLQPGESGHVAMLDPQLANLPRSFLDYVGPTGAGQELLQAPEVNRITEYLYSVEATTASHGSVLLEVLKLLTSALRSLEKAATNESEFSPAQESLRKARSHMGHLESYPVIRDLSKEIEDIADQVVTPPSTGLIGNHKDFVSGLSAQLTGVVQRIRELRRQGQFDSVS